MGIDTKVPMPNMGKTNFGLNVVAAIFKFKMAAHTEIRNVIFTFLIRFLDKFIGVSNTELLAKPNSARTGWRPF